MPETPASGLIPAYFLFSSFDGSHPIASVLKPPHPDNSNEYSTGGLFSNGVIFKEPDPISD